ncbi:MAG TPA: anaerobic sulfatase maturase [bacterium]|nr:anaerobic sulfatase maturase [bacterium]HPP08972.1 anaerobic sulfatase maturase [bacterium]
MKQFSLLIKPVSSQCNSDCDYCFYKNLTVYKNQQSTFMTRQVVEILIKKYLSTQQNQYIFSWQGGEPLLMGLDFYKDVIHLQQTLARPGSVIGNGIQTNGYLIDEMYADFFSTNNFLVGISCDGPEHLHNKFRKIPDGRNAFHLVMDGIKILQKHNVAFNTLTVVTSEHAGKGKLVYQFLKDIGSDYHQYIPCVEYDKNRKKLPWTIEGINWGKFLIEIFQQWLIDSQKISIRLFDSIILVLLGQPSGICQIERNCCQYFVVEHNGDVFPCDFFVRNDTLLGNITGNMWDDLLNSEKYRSFGTRKSLWHSDCDRCQYLKFCAGDCQKHRTGKGKSGRPKSVLCEGWQLFYKETLPEFKRIAQSYRQSYLRRMSIEF